MGWLKSFNRNFLMKHLIKISLLIFFLLHVEAECDDARFVQANVNDRTVDISTIIVTGLF